MKRVIAGSFMAAAFAVGLAAQATSPQSQPPMQESKDATKNVTVTGCLKAGDTADSFILSNLKWGGDKAVGTSGTAPAAPAISATSLKLTGSPSGGKLGDHVGHTVEVTGSIDKADKDADKDKPAASASAAPSLNARTIRMVAATCQ